MVGRGQRPGSYREFGDLARHLRYVERGSRKLARSTFYGMVRWQAAAERHQAFLGRIVDIGTELFAMSAVCVRAQLDAAEASGTERGATAPELADLFCVQARRRVESLFAALWRNDDVPAYEAGQRVLRGRYRWLEEGIVDPSGPGPMIAQEPDEEREEGAPVRDEAPVGT